MEKWDLFDGERQPLNKTHNRLYKYKEMDFDTCISGRNVVLGKDVIEKILNKI